MIRENSNKKICIIRSNPVKPDSRVEKEAWTLKKQGYDVHILAWDRDSSCKETEDYVKVGDERIPITRLGYKATYGEGFKNIKAYLSFQFHMRKWLKKNDFHVIHACDFDTAFFSYGVVRKKKEKFVFDIFDFLYDRPESFAQKCVKKAQYVLINRADATIICSEERREQIAGSKPKQLVVIHNTPSSIQVENASVISVDPKRIKIVYVGILQDYRLLKEIAETAKALKEIDFHIGGFGKYEDFFSDMASAYDNIHFHGRLSYADTLELEKSCDIMLAIYDPSISNHFYAAPNKFYESLMLGKPVIMVKNTGMSKVVEENNIGVLIDYSKEGFEIGLAELLSQKSQWKEMSDRMRQLYQTSYCWERMADRLLNMYASIL